MCLSISVNNPSNVLEKGEFSGFQYVITHNFMGFRCGYVRVPSGHSFHGSADHDGVLDVHGGITFAEADVPCDAPGDDSAWWLGFDCGHYLDSPDPSLPGCTHSLASAFYDGEIRDTDYVRGECESLAAQLAAL